MGGTTRTLPTGIVTFLMTDVEGSTRHWQRDADAMERAERRHRDILSASIGAHGGAFPEEQGEGDSLVAAFDSASDAIVAALDAQRSLAAERWSTTSPIRVRMAVHTGEARLRDDRNYAGESIIRAARLRALAAGGQVLVSRSAVDALADGAFADAELRRLGEVRLRDLRRPEHVYQLVHPDLADDFPPVRGVEAYPNNLPIQLSSFVGREADLAQVHALVEDVRLLTLTGSGGCGKTRLALQVAADRLALHADGTWYVELAPLGDDDAIASTLAAALSLNVPADQTPLEAVLTELRDRRALLVIDNCEHLLDGAAEVINRLLAELPAIRIIATSRQPLELPAETTWRVPSLGVPGDGADVEQLTQFDAVRLFLERAIRVRPDFAVNNDNAATVAAICAALDGIPLAIELAASRVRSLPVERIADALDDRFRLLSGNGRAVPDRHQTLRASVEWSHDLLTDEQQRVFRRLSQFAGGFDLSAVEAVAADDGIDRYAIFEVLAELVDRSLVLFDTDDERYRLLETMKQFGHEQLGLAGEIDAVRHRHAEHFSAVAATEADRLTTGDQPAARARLVADRDNLRVALEWWETSRESDRLALLACDLVFFWLQTARFHEGAEWLDRAAAAAEGTPAGARSLWGRAYLAFYYGDYDQAYEFGAAAEAAGRRVDDPLTIARAIDVQADVTQLNDPMGGIEPLQEALALAEQHGDVWTIADLNQKIGFSLLFAERFDEAPSWFEQAKAFWEPTGNRFFSAWHYYAVALIEEARGSRDTIAAAEACQRDAIASGDPTTESAAVWRQVAALLRFGEIADARRVATEAAADFRRRRIGGLTPLLVDLFTALVEIADGDPVRGLELAQPALDVARTEDITFFDAVLSSSVLGGVAMLGGIDELERVALHTVDRARALTAARTQGRGHEFLAAVALLRDDPATALSELTRAEELWDPQYRADRSEALRLAAWAHAQAGDAATSRVLLATARAADAANGWFLWPHVAEWEAATERLLATDAADAEPLDLDDAVALALRGRGKRLRPTTGWLSLTPTELQVAEAVSDGLNNPAIGERLHMSRGPVKTHLSHIFTKLDISSRAELATRFAAHR